VLLQGRLGDPAAYRIRRCRFGDEARGGPVTGDRVIRFATAAVVCAVAAVAAVVSYSTSTAWAGATGRMARRPGCCR
jgi:hypothetical protein